MEIHRLNCLPTNVDTDHLLLLFSHQDSRILEMEKITNVANVTIGDCKESQYIKPVRLHYVQSGKQQTWDAFKVHDSVCILLYNKSRDVFLFVAQFRPAIYYNRAEVAEQNGTKFIDTGKYPGSLGVAYELCAGIVDKACSLAEIAQAEVLEECGYKVPLDCIERITSYRAGVGTSGSLQTFFYAEVTDEMKVGSGGGTAQEGELIEVVEVPVSEGRSFIMDETIVKPVGMMFAVFWFYENKAK
ncbi:hypothetical protein ScPMuIL_014741 [Solemya velum]